MRILRFFPIDEISVKNSTFWDCYLRLYIHGFATVQLPALINTEARPSGGNIIVGKHKWNLKLYYIMRVLDLFILRTIYRLH